MSSYYVEVNGYEIVEQEEMVDWSGSIEADTEEEAVEIARDNFADTNGHDAYVDEVYAELEDE